jgi:thiamine biosynthesis lipoprotein
MIVRDPGFPLHGRRVYVDLPEAEAIERFPCFGGNCGVLVTGPGPSGTAREAALRARRRLLAWHGQFSRFEQASELSRLNDDPRGTVAVSQLMADLVEAAVNAARISGGLVDPTLVPELERAGYSDHFAAAPLSLTEALALAPPRLHARPSHTARWREVRVDRSGLTVTRPPGVRIDSGGVAKGLFGDVLASELSGHRAFAVDAAGDVRSGGSAAVPRRVEVASPFDGSVLHVFELGEGAAATSGIGRRSWMGQNGRPAHHLLDPATGRPAFTGIVQVTARAPTGCEAELRSKAALLSGPAGATEWLSHGGVIVYDDGAFQLVEASS